MGAGPVLNLRWRPGWRWASPSPSSVYLVRNPTDCYHDRQLPALSKRPDKCLEHPLYQYQGETPRYGAEQMKLAAVLSYLPAGIAEKCLPPWAWTEEQQHKFGSLLGAFQDIALPHGGLAFGFDRLCFHPGRQRSIRGDFIAFPKQRRRDVMLDAICRHCREAVGELQRCWSEAVDRKMDRSD